MLREFDTGFKQLPFGEFVLFIPIIFFLDDVLICIEEIKVGRLQNSPYFCVFRYARAVKQKVWNDAENRERDWGETLKIRFFFSRLTRP